MNKKSFLFITISLFVVLSISAVYSTDMSDDSIDANDDMAIDKTNEQNIVQSEVKLSNDNIVENTKNLKKDTKEVIVNNYGEMITEVGNAKSATSPVIISLKPGNYNATAQITWGGSNNKNLTINGNGLVLDGNNKYKFALVQANNYLTLTNITLKNYNSSGPGGAIQCLGQINIANATFINNTATSTAGGVITIQDFSNKHSTIEDCIFISNTAVKASGGAVNINYARVTINNTKFINNTAKGDYGYGGAIYNMGTLTIENSLFEGNNNTQYIGGAIANDNKVTIVNTTFRDNYAGRYGGAIYHGANDLNIIDSTFEYNNASVGGAIYSTSKIDIEKSVFESNTATSAAAIFANKAIVLDNNTFKSNKADDETLLLDTTTKTLSNNIYTNTSIAHTEFILTSDKEKATVGEDIPMNCVLTLVNPSYYDEDILDKNIFQIFVNDENKYNSTGKTFTLNMEESGVYTVYAYDPISNSTTNSITIEVEAEVVLVVNSITATIGDKITITAQIQQDDEVLSDLSMGKVAFKVNGKTLKDDSGKVIYAKVVNGIATIEDYLVPESWNKEAIIQATYSGSSDCGKLTSNKTEINIVSIEPTVTTQDVETSAGSTITLTATVTDGDKIINTGKIVFKINGKSIKDEQGKVIYAKVSNNIASTVYTIPETFKTGTYTLTAVFLSSEYDRIEDTKVLTII